MKSNKTKPTENSKEDHNEEEMEMDEDTEMDEETNEQEYETLNSQIDQLNLVLDVLEKKNEHIQAQLVELLKSNREEREKQQTSEKNPTS